MPLSSLTLRTKLIGLAGLCIALACALTATGYWATRTLSTSLSEVTVTSRAIKNFMLGDMMHDALRADVLTALRLGPEGPEATRRKATEDLREHVATFREAVAENQKLPLGDDARSAITAVVPRLNSYIAAAEDLAATAMRDRAAADARYPAFVQSFDELADAQEVVAEILEQLAAATNARGSENAQTTQRVLLAGAAFGVAVVGALSIIILLSITRPLLALRNAMGKLAEGDVASEVPGLTRKDEIGLMAGAVQVFKDSMIRNAKLEAEQKSAQESQLARARAIEGYIAAFDRSVTGALRLVSSASTELESTANSMSATAEEATRQATAVAAASEQATTNVQTVASAAEELSSSIAEISRQVSESTRIAGQAADEAGTTNAQIKGLAEAAQSIGDVVKLINDIASQTNLLALNATIEAARAGEAGKGFAVVASEVKSLANQTAKATEEISAKIAEMQSATGQSVQAIGTITQTIGRINEIAATIASAVEEQGAATQEIARNVQQASAGTAEVNANIGGVTKAATDTGAAAAQVLSSSGELSKQSETLRAGVDGFLQKIRAA